MAPDLGSITRNSGNKDFATPDEEDHDNEVVFVGDSASTAHSASMDHEDSADNEIEAVRNASRNDTCRIRMWRIVLTLALLSTTAIVTGITFKFLEDEQVSNFKTAYDQFSRTIGDAAVAQQASLRTSYLGFRDSISTYVASTDNEWPLVTIPYFRRNAEAILVQSRTEALLLMHRVQHSERPDWEGYSVREHEAMVQEAHMLENGNLGDLNPVGFHPYISTPSARGFVEEKDFDEYYPAWEYAPAPYTYGFVNLNLMQVPETVGYIEPVLEFTDEIIFSIVRSYRLASGVSFTVEEHEAFHAKLVDSTTEHPHSFFYMAVRERVEDPDSRVVAILGGAVAWDASLIDLLPENVKGLTAVIRNTCGQAYTYRMEGRAAIFMGEDDLHERKYDSYERVVDLTPSDNPEYLASDAHCRYAMHVYPSHDFENSYNTFTPETFAMVVMATFLFVIVVFFIYDSFVHRRNEKLVENAARSNAIVSSMFPSNIRDRLIAENQGNAKTADKRITNLKNYLNGYADQAAVGASKKPLADLFLETSVLFADIAGFTAWSSVREPSQVFTLLETVFSSFDHIAKTRRVFKVETVGDCYVAATGIPTPRKDHAVIMVRFAKDILTRIHVITKELEITHGPDTADLSLRCGIHSGPVTAGVLRGERARFQLFGDTMNTASRIEHTGHVGRIQVSTETAECLKACGKGHWTIKREDLVEAKGKGVMQTYWIGSLGGQANGSQASDADGETKNALLVAASDHGNLASTNGASQERPTGMIDGLEERSLRLVDWNVQMFLHTIKQIIARREAAQVGTSTGRASSLSMTRSLTSSADKAASDSAPMFAPFEEVEEIIHLPDFDHHIARKQQDPDDVSIDPVVIRQLRSFIIHVALMYKANSFHNFEHASHVTMSVIKLLTRIVAPSDDDDDDGGSNGFNANLQERNGRQERSSPFRKDHAGGVATAAATLHDHTYGITSDPLTQFACAFAALIHDVDHSGVPNAVLVKEGTRLAQIYNNRSVAEQNSLALSWELFMSEEYAELRSCICPTAAEIDRFRQLVVNAVMATDIVDKELKQLRNDRWDKAFSNDFEESPRNARDRKATIVIEHLIQASDVAHTMQHWHVYRKWNERFFRECYNAYRSGRTDTNPVDGWYKGELGFFDFYIIPLARKLKDCGVFGKSSDEYLTYALANRKEWERRGEEVVSEMVENLGG